jgi:hypothetical protein
MSTVDAVSKPVEISSPQRRGVSNTSICDLDDLDE